MNAWLQAGDETEAQERLHLLGCTDGLPVVIPTAERIEGFLSAVPSLAADQVVGVVPPRMGAATVESVAANAVMAGCAPGHLPVVCAAVRAACDPAFTLEVVQGTTHNAAVLLIVNGSDTLPPPPFASGSGALGPGHRANATVGRALRLVLINAGGGLPGAGDMSTLGQPAKFTCCVAEAEGESPFPPLAATRGVRVAAVTVLAVEGPRQVMFVPVGDSGRADAGRLISLLGSAVASPGTLGGMGYRGSSAVLLSPLHARVLADAGHDRRSLAAAVHDAAVIPAEDIRRRHGRLRGSGHRPDDRMHAPSSADERPDGDRVHAPSSADERPDGDRVHALSSPDHLLVAVAGGPGTYSAVFCGLADGVGCAVTVPC